MTYQDKQSWLITAHDVEKQMEKPLEQRFMPRGEASDILGEMADAGESGHCHSDPYEVGRAIGRLLPNNGVSDEVNMWELLRGLGDRGLIKRVLKMEERPESYPTDETH